ncbi:Bax inhibitor-1/YccA family protein [soil metagenome]
MLPTMRASNPTLSENAFSSAGLRSAQPMTLQGTVNKSAFFLMLAFFTAVMTWSKVHENPAGAMPWIFGSAIVGFIFAIITHFKKEWSAMTGSLYALAEGVFLGGISAMYEARFHGLVLQAVLLTFGVFLALLAVYTLRLVTVNDKFRTAIFAATGGIALVYLATIVLGFFNVQIPYIHGSGAIGIGFSLIVVGIAAMNLLLDFDMIERGVIQGAPKYMEWYAAFGLLVTLVWLYLEILRLLAKIAGRRD